MPPRAPAMEPDQRRAAIVEVAVPLLRRDGSNVTTKQVAEAAGIAEGTLFRAFGTKEELVHACAEAVFDNGDALRDLAAIDRDLRLDDRLVAAVAVLQRRLERIIGLLGALHASGALPEHGGRDHGRGTPDPGPHGRATPSSAVPPGRRLADPDVDAAVLDLIGPDAATLRIPAGDVVNILAHLTLASAHPMFPVRPMTPREIVAVLLDGTRKDR